MRHLIRQVTRQAYRRALHVVTYLETAVTDDFFDPVTAESETALDLLQRILGAKRLA